MPAPFGEDRYYSQQSESDFTSDEDAIDFFRSVLADGDDLEERIRRSSERWSARARQKINSAMKFNLSYDDKQESIPVEVSNQIPPPFARLYKKHPDPLKWRLLLEQTTLETTKEGLRLVGRNVSELKTHFEALNDAEVGEHEFFSVRGFIERLLGELRESKVLEAIRDIKVDVLGAYHFRVPIIQLYWVPIATVSRLIDMPVETLTVVVQLHERAHAYTHRGFDTDGHQWPTEAFAGTELPVVEGLAQYYTWMVCNSVEETRPDLLETFERLLNLQPDPYREFQEWKLEGEPSGEIIREAMIAARAQEATALSRFRKMLNYTRDLHAGR